MKRILAIALAAGVLPLAMAGGPRAEPALGPVSIGHSSADVARVLGTAPRIDRTDDFVDAIHRYPTISVGFNDDVVASIQTTDPRMCTPQGLCVGASFKAMQRLHGAPSIRTPGSGRYEYPAGDGACWYEMSVATGLVEAMQVICLP